jgi:hypothetical protein
MKFEFFRIFLIFQEDMAPSEYQVDRVPIEIILSKRYARAPCILLTLSRPTLTLTPYKYTSIPAYN